MKKLLSVFLACLMVLSLAACTAGGKGGSASNGKVKVGFIFLHDENSTYDLNFINAAKEACEKAGVEYVLKTNIPEVRNATKQLANSHIQAATSYSQTVSVMKIT